MRGATSQVPVSGFVLLEVVLALALFASVATAMTVAMNQLAVSTTSARRESILLRRLQSEIAETAHQLRLELGNSSEPEDAMGIIVEREVSRLKVTNREGAPLDGLYRIRVMGTMVAGPGKGDDLVREMETFEIRLAEIQAVQAGAAAGANQAPPADPSTAPLKPNRGGGSL
ncbi:MAG: hypothetical protein DVB23_003313 [Verrucomicrobia bacterium]|jgi:hypothetical protein|nr:MAG: hypothetical protein DVB23_003313 [Verrucomicrobiota bacterium]